MKTLHISDGNIEALKWVGLVLMTGDHINKYLFNATLPFLFEAGRLCLPIFVFVLAYNLARPSALKNGVYQRTMARLAVAGLLASAPYIALGGLLGGYWPLNVLFTMLVLTGALFLLESFGNNGKAFAGLVCLFGGGLVEFAWPAVIGGLAVWQYYKKPSITPLIIVALSCAALRVVNGNWWALAAIPLITIFSFINVPVRRQRWAFYAYYPLHLAALWSIRIPMSKAGYLFFY